MVDKLHKGFSKLSLDLTKDIDKDIKKNSGIFFTPPATISTTLQYLKEYNINFNRILEPSCGSCEFITQINKLYPTAHITGIELNQHIFNSIKSCTVCKNVINRFIFFRRLNCFNSRPFIDEII